MSKKKIACLLMNLNINKDVNVILRANEGYIGTNCKGYIAHDEISTVNNYSSSWPQHVKNAIPFSQFLRLRRLCSDDTVFNNK